MASHCGTWKWNNYLLWSYWCFQSSHRRSLLTSFFFKWITALAIRVSLFYFWSRQQQLAISLSHYTPAYLTLNDFIFLCSKKKSLVCFKRESIFLLRSSVPWYCEQESQVTCITSILLLWISTHAGKIVGKQSRDRVLLILPKTQGSNYI